MGVSSVNVDSVPAGSFTPQEPLVELLRVCLAKNCTPFLSEANEKPFLVTWLVKEWSKKWKENETGSILLLVPTAEKVTLWQKFLKSLTCVHIRKLDNIEEDSKSLVIATPDELIELNLKNFKLSLAILDNSHLLPEQVTDLIGSFSPSRIVSLVANVFRDENHCSLLKPANLNHLLTSVFKSEPEACSDLLSTLRFFCQPSKKIVLYQQSHVDDYLLHSSSKASKECSQVQTEIDAIIGKTRQFLLSHRFSLLEIYGDEFQDLIEDVPDPTALPLKLLEDFVHINENLGLWCAERAALLLIIKIEKLKTREKYERHFILLSVLYSDMVKIRKICELAFEEMSELDRLMGHSTPRLLKLVEIFKQYKPDHVCPTSKTPTTKSEVDPAPIKMRGGQHRYKGGYSSYDDPNALCASVFVENKFTAKLLYHFLKDLSRTDDAFSFLMPQYATNLDNAGGDDHELLEGYEMEAESKRQEDSLRRFRMKECNLLISSSLLEVGVDNVRCNLVVAFDFPKTFKHYANQKVKAKASKSHFLIFSEEKEEGLVKNLLNEFAATESLLRSNCAFPGLLPIEGDCTSSLTNNKEAEDRVPITSQKGYSPFYSINRYCSKLPSDTFTRLTPLFGIECRNRYEMNCRILLPINSPVRNVVVGPSSSNGSIQEAQFHAAIKVCEELRKVNELDENMLPYGREISKRSSELPKPNTQSTSSELIEKSSSPPVIKEPPGRPGTTKRRQYYNKQVAPPFSTGKEETTIRGHLYAFKMKLTCALPEEQNTRGRKIHPPENAALSFGLLVPNKMPSICQFPIYTRDGEIFVETKLIAENLDITENQVSRIAAFHRFTFSQVLKLEKYPMVFKPTAENDSSNLFIVPLDNSTESINWTFLDSIEHGNYKLETVSEEDRLKDDYHSDKYLDAVVTPWYRNQDQPQFFYVAEVCDHLSPKSDFPGQGFDTFEKYYRDKYQIQVQHLDQPLLDVDHTSARLNFLTPRYVNRKGMSLPTSSEETKKSKRENLEQKQILVPELCRIHPFPASLWRQAVCLPCVLYRLNSLLVADHLRARVAKEMSLGQVLVPDDHKWPNLHFGWTLSDVIQAGSSQAKPGISNSNIKSNKDEEISPIDDASNVKDSRASPIIFDSKEGLSQISCKLMNKLNEEESKLRQTNSSLEIGTWSNDMAEIEQNARRSKASGMASSDHQSEFEDDFDPFEALPPNLTFLDDASLPQVNPTGDPRDWGTGIAQKKFRVGSPTFFSNPNINIPGLLDDMDGFSCSDSEDEDANSQSNLKQFDIDEVEDVGNNVRIEFRGRNLAEAIEDEEQTKDRIDTLAKNQQEDLDMVSNLPWKTFDKDNLDIGKKEFEKNEWSVLNAEDKFVKDLYQQPLCSQPDDQTYQNNLNVLSLPSLPCYQSQPNINDDDQCGILHRDNDVVLKFSFDQQPNLSESYGPSPSLLLQALTMSNSNDVINLERLETIGDSFLKYAVTCFLYCTYPYIHEGKLSHLRSKQVSNLNLYRLGRDKKLGELMVATKFEPHDNWLPPCYHVPKAFEQALINSGVPSTHWNMADMPADVSECNAEEISHLIKERNNDPGAVVSSGVAAKRVRNHLSSEKELETMPSFVPYNLLTQHSIPDKSIADCVEALIGAYLTSCGTQGALLLMSWMGLTVLPKDGNGQLPQPPSPLLSRDEISLGQMEYLLQGFQGFEKTIGYKFKDRSYLLQALTHASYYPNRLTDCYQRLEFLGDAVLDYLITRHLYEDQRQHSPGTLTDLRSALVNNTIFATLAVRFDFHKYFLHFSPGLHNVVSKFVKMQVASQGELLDDFYLFDNDNDDGPQDEAEDVEVPKALGDIFESVAGAIFLDSGLSLDSVWRVYYRMMQSSIDLYSSNVPKSPIREILELEPETAQFGKPEKLADGRRVRCTLEIIGKGVFKGIGRSYRIAKCTAAKCALRAMKATSHNHGKSS